MIRFRNCILWLSALLLLACQNVEGDGITSPEQAAGAGHIAVLEEPGEVSEKAERRPGAGGVVAAEEARPFGEVPGARSERSSNEDLLEELGSKFVDNYNFNRPLLESGIPVKILTNPHSWYEDIAFVLEEDIEWIENIGRERLAWAAVELGQLYLSEKRWETFGAEDGVAGIEITENFLMERLRSIMSEVDQVDVHAEVDERGRFIDPQYENGWSSITKLAYRWEKRIPGICNAVDQELRNRYPAF